MVDKHNNHTKADGTTQTPPNSGTPTHTLSRRACSCVSNAPKVFHAAAEIFTIKNRKPYKSRMNHPNSEQLRTTPAFPRTRFHAALTHVALRCLGARDSGAGILKGPVRVGQWGAKMFLCTAVFMCGRGIVDTRPNTQIRIARGERGGGGDMLLSFTLRNKKTLHYVCVGRCECGCLGVFSQKRNFDGVPSARSVACTLPAQLLMRDESTLKQNLTAGR